MHAHTLLTDLVLTLLFYTKRKTLSYPCPHSWLFKQSFPPAKRMRCSDAHKSCRLWARRMNHLVSVYMQDSRGSLFSLLCKSTVTSRFLNYLPVLRVIAHSTNWSLHAYTLTLSYMFTFKKKVVCQMLAMRICAPRDDDAGFKTDCAPTEYLFLLLVWAQSWHRRQWVESVPLNPKNWPFLELFLQILGCHTDCFIQMMMVSFKLVQLSLRENVYLYSYAYMNVFI